jgi:hypothetical protein
MTPSGCDRTASNSVVARVHPDRVRCACVECEPELTEAPEPWFQMDTRVLNDALHG